VYFRNVGCVVYFRNVGCVVYFRNVGCVVYFRNSIPCPLQEQQLVSTEIQFLHE